MKKLLLIIATFLLTFAVYAQQDFNNQFSDNVAETYQIKIYPNPVTDLTFKIAANKSIFKVEILNVIGQKVQTIENEVVSDRMSIDLFKCDRGIYLVKVIFTDKKTLIRKILVK